MAHSPLAISVSLNDDNDDNKRLFPVPGIEQDYRKGVTTVGLGPRFAMARIHSRE